MNRRTFIRNLLGAGIALGVRPITSTGASVPRNAENVSNVLWIMMDDCRADALSCYGQPWSRTPHMDGIAADGIRFESAIVQNPVCVPQRKSMMTSQYPHTLQHMAMGEPPEIPPPYYTQQRTCPVLLNQWEASGIQPANIGKVHAYRSEWNHLTDIRPRYNVLGEPVDDLAKSREKSPGSGTHFPAVKTRTHGWQIGGTIPLAPEETSIAQLGAYAADKLTELAEADDPFFLRVSFHAPHVPCRVPPEYFIDPATISLPLPSLGELETKPRFEREQLRTYAGGLDLTEEQINIARGTYYGMVWFVDDQVGRLVDVLKRTGRYENTIIVINSDSGFQLGEHGMWKKRVFYEQNVKVPFIISAPGSLPAGVVVSEPVELVDFLPTLLDLSGFPPPENTAGRSLIPLITGDISSWGQACFSEIDHSMSMYEELRSNSGRRLMVRTREWKMIYFKDSRLRNKDGALYNLVNDPGEHHNLYYKPGLGNVIRYLENLAEEWDGSTTVR